MKSASNTVTFRDSLHPCHADSDPIEKFGQLSPQSFSIYLFDHRDRQSTAIRDNGKRRDCAISHHFIHRVLFDIGDGRALQVQKCL